MSVKTKVITVTPKDAESYLKGMVNNRICKRSQVVFLADSMKRGDWRLTGQPVIFSEKGKLLDGQHRMRAIIESGVSVEVLAVYGVDPSMFSKMDQVNSRTIADCISTTPNRHNVAAVLRWIYVEERAGNGVMASQGQYKPTNDEALALFDRFPAAVNAVSHCTRYKRAGRMATPSILAYCLFRMRSDNPTEADRFVERMETGEGLSKRSPLLSLRNQLIDGKRIDGVPTRWNPALVIASIGVAWYMTLDGVAKAMKMENSPGLWKGWRTNL